MLVNKKNKRKSKFVALFLIVGLMATAGVASAAEKSAWLYGNGVTNTKNTEKITASKDGTGKLYATNTSANLQTRAYAKRSIAILPDSTVADTGWFNPYTAKQKTFTQKDGKKYYGQIVGQTAYATGGVRITVY